MVAVWAGQRRVQPKCPPSSECATFQRKQGASQASPFHKEDDPLMARTHGNRRPGATTRKSENSTALALLVNHADHTDAAAVIEGVLVDDEQPSFETASVSAILDAFLVEHGGTAFAWCRPRRSNWTWPA
jgi:hypothetical protein